MSGSSLVLDHMDTFILLKPYFNHQPGRPPKFGHDWHRQLCKVVKENNSTNTKILSKFLREAKGLNISARTVFRSLNQIGLKKLKPRFVPKINDNQRRAHVLFAKKHCKPNFNNIIFSDESTFQLDHNAHMV